MDSSSQCRKVNSACKNIMRNGMYTGAAIFVYYISNYSRLSIPCSPASALCS